MKNYFRTLSVFGCVLLLTGMIFRTTGIHSDEVNYLRMSEKYFFGDTYYSQKPCLFYIVNYALGHSIGRLFGPLYPWSLYLIHIILISLGLLWAIAPLYDGRRKVRFFLTYLLLISSPLTLLNSTQWMMETPVLFLLAMIFGCLFHHGDFRKKILGLSAAAMMFKTTALCPLIILTLIFWKEDRKKAIALLQGITLGYCLSSILIGIAHFYPPDFSFPTPTFRRELSDFLDFGRNLKHLKMTSFYLYSWIFFAGPSSLLALALHFFRRRNPFFQESPNTKNSIYIHLIISSWAFTFCIQNLSEFFYIRYTYPTLFIGLLAGIYYVGRSSALIVMPLLILTLAQSFPLFSYGTERFLYWPTLVNAEFFQTRLTLFYGTPVHATLMNFKLRSENPCIEFHLNPKEEIGGWYARYLQFIFPGSCDHSSNLQIWRKEVPDFTSPISLGCQEGYSFGSFQEILFPQVQEGTNYLNFTCARYSNRL